jgi:hypothetical protein
MPNPLSKHYKRRINLFFVVSHKIFAVLAINGPISLIADGGRVLMLPEFQSEDNGGGKLRWWAIK